MQALILRNLNHLLAVILKQNRKKSLPIRLKQLRVVATVFVQVF
jgi:hypothetical protein